MFTATNSLILKYLAGFTTTTSTDSCELYVKMGHVSRNNQKQENISSEKADEKVTEKKHMTELEALNSIPTFTSDLTTPLFYLFLLTLQTGHTPRV